MGKTKSSKKKTDQPDAEQLSFEEALTRLEGIVAQLENGQLGLSESLAFYEQGIKHLRTCYHQLDQAEQKIELLAGLDAEGNPVAEPFDEGPTSLEQKQATRSRRRSRGGVNSSSVADPPDPDPPGMDDSTALF